MVKWKCCASIVTDEAQSIYRSRLKEVHCPPNPLAIAQVFRSIIPIYVPCGVPFLPNPSANNSSSEILTFASLATVFNTLLLLTALFYKELLFYTFDPLAAQAQGMPTKIYYIGLVTAITLTVVASLQTVGSLLVIAMLVGPAVTAYLLVKELHTMMIWGSVFGAVSSVVGMYMSYYLDIPSGAAIVLIVFGFFFLTFLFSFSYKRLK